MRTSGEPAGRTPMRPALRPALRVLRRDRLTLQVGTDPQRAVAYSVRDPVHIDLICALDGRRTVEELATRFRVPTELVADLVTELEAAGLVEDGGRPPFTACCPSGHPGCTADHPASGGRARARRRELTESMRRLAPDLAAWDLLEPAGDGGRSEWERRSRATVEVVGSGRVGLAVGVLLGAAGIGRVVGGDDRPARQADRGALALAGPDLGSTRREGLRRRLAGVAPATVLLDAAAARPDLVVLASETAPDRALAGHLSRRGIAHLAVTVTETVAVVGPFVQPGHTACLRCLDIYRADRDPAWPLVLDRLALGRVARDRPGETGGGSSTTAGSAPGPGPGAELTAVGCDDVLTTLAAAHTVLHVTTALRGERPPSADATCEFRLPTGQPRRRTWSQQPDCGCGWGARPTAGAGAEDNGQRERAAP